MPALTMRNSVSDGASLFRAMRKLCKVNGSLRTPVAPALSAASVAFSEFQGGKTRIGISELCGLFFSANIVSSPCISGKSRDMKMSAGRSEAALKTATKPLGAWITS